MCFSAKVSIGTFVLGFVSSFLVYSLGTTDDKIIGLFFAFTSLMQWIEYLLWNHVKCDDYNRYLSITAMVINHLQPIILGALVLGYNPQITTKNHQLILGILAIYIVCIVPYSLQFVMDTTQQCTIKTPNNHLYWKWNDMPMYMLTYIVFILSVFVLFRVGLVSSIHGQYMAYTGLVLFGISKLIYYDTGMIGSMWCFFAAFTPLVWYLLRIFRVIK